MLEQLHALARWWDSVYNAVVIHDQVIGYLVVSAARILIALAAWQLLKALARYVQVAFPPPHTFDNALYWLRWWFWLRLREFGLLKVGAFLVALLLVLQIPAGITGGLAQATLYLLLIYPAQFAMLLGMAQLLNHLTDRIQHPSE